MKERRVVITGMGVVCAIGDNIQAFLDGLQKGRNGITKLEMIDTSNCLTDKGGEVKSLGSCKEQAGRTLSFALKAADEAVVDSGLAAVPADSSVVIGTSLGNFEFLEASIYNAVKDGGIKTKNDALNWEKGSLSNIPAAIARKFNLNGLKLTISTACAAGGNSIAYAYELVKKGYCSVAVAGGTDSIYSISLTGFSSLMSLTRDYPKPFAENRDGLTLGEGAGILILEEKENALQRKAKIYAEIAGYALRNDAYHITSPDPKGSGAYSGMLECIKNSKVKKDEVRYINAHGTGTKANDIMELRAIERLFGDNKKPVYVSSNKSMFGHCLGAAGSIEAISTVLSITNGFVPPTINIEIPLRFGEQGKSAVKIVAGEKISADINFALSNSFAFAGNVATLGFKKYED